MEAVSSVATINGLDAAIFKGSATMQDDYCKGIAKTASVDPTQCSITNVLAARRANAQVTTAVTMVGDNAAANAAAARTKLADKSALQTNLKAQGSLAATT